MRGAKNLSVCQEERGQESCYLHLSALCHEGARRTPANMGDHTGLGGKLEPVEDRSVSEPADRGHGDHGPWAVSSPYKTSQRV